MGCETASNEYIVVDMHSFIFHPDHGWICLGDFITCLALSLSLLIGLHFSFFATFVIISLLSFTFFVHRPNAAQCLQPVRRSRNIGWSVIWCVFHINKEGAHAQVSSKSSFWRRSSKLALRCAAVGNKRTLALIWGERNWGNLHMKQLYPSHVNT